MKKVLLTLCAAIVALTSQAQLVDVFHETFYSDDGTVTGYPAGSTTYRIYGRCQDPTDALYSVFAAGNNPMTIGTDGAGIWNSGFGGITGPDLNAAFFPFFPQSEYDSMVTIGRASNADGGGAITVAEAAFTNSVTEAFGTAAPADEIDSNAELTDGTWFCTPADANAYGVAPDNRVLLAQITTTGDIAYQLNIQLNDEGVGGAVLQYVWDQTAVDAGQELECTLEYPADPTCGVTGVDGCTDPTACDYNSAATNDTGCTYATGCDTCSGETDGTGTVVDNPEVGESCDDGDAGTMNDTVQGDCSCAGTPIVMGCTDNTACNYNSAANMDDSSCVFATGCDTCSGETDGTGTVVDNPEVGESCDDGDAGTMNDTVQGDCSCAGTPIVMGCTDNTACNYNSAANMDDSSCVFATGCDVCSGETDGTGTVIDNPEVGESCDDGDAGTMNDTVQGDCSCAGTPIVMGCTDNTACNYNSAANMDDSSCVFATGCDTCSGETDGTGTVVDNPEVGESCDDGNPGTINDTVQGDCTCAGIGTILGCMDAGACNYNVNANVDDASCVFATGCDTCSGEIDGTGTVVDNPEVGESCDDGDAGTMNDTVQGDCSCAGTPIVMGCTDNTACNYNSAANMDDSSCVFATGCDVCSGETDGSGTVIDNPEVGEACDDGDAGTMNDTVQGDCSCAGVVIVPGCTDAGACNYNPAANMDDGSCDFVSCAGCMDAGACNYDATATIDDGSCEYVSCAGCMDVAACNYDATATIDDGSCAYPGDACDDGDAGTINDTYDGSCDCSGTVVGGGPATPLPLTPLGTCDPIAGDVSGGDVSFEIVPFTSGVRIEVSTSAFDAVVTILDATAAVVASINVGGTGDEYLNVGNLTAGDTYEVVVSSASGAGAFGICGQSLPDTRADYGAGPYDLCDIYKADWVAADDYRFRFLQSDVVMTEYTQGAANTLLPLSNVPLLDLDATYNVRIDAGFDLSLADGSTELVWVMADEDNAFATLPQPTTQMRAQDNCANHGPHFLGDYIKATPWVCSSSDWEWTFTRTDVTEMDIVYLRGSTNRWLRLSNVPGLVAGATYDVSVRPIYPNGTATTYGPIECMTIVGPAPGEAADGPVAEEQIATERMDVEPTAAIYPNPNNGEFMNVNLTDVEGKVTVDIINGMGAIVKSMQLTVAGDNVNEVIALNGIASGVYMVNITVNNTVITERLVIQK